MPDDGIAVRDVLITAAAQGAKMGVCECGVVAWCNSILAFCAACAALNVFSTMVSVVGSCDYRYDRCPACQSTGRNETTEEEYAKDPPADATCSDAEVVEGWPDGLCSAWE